MAANVVGITGDISRFPTRDRFAAFNGTAPIEVSSGGRKIWRLSRRGNRTLNHAIHMAAVTQVRFPHSPGRGYYDRKIAEGKTPKEAMRALKRRISDALWAAMVADARRAAATKGRRDTRRAREDNRGTTLSPARPAHTPTHRLFGQATPGPGSRLRRPVGAHGATPRGQRPRRPERHLDKQRGLDLFRFNVGSGEIGTAVWTRAGWVVLRRFDGHLLRVAPGVKLQAVRVGSREVLRVIRRK